MVLKLTQWAFKPLYLEKFFVFDFCLFFSNSFFFLFNLTTNPAGQFSFLFIYFLQWSTVTWGVSSLVFFGLKLHILRTSRCWIWIWVSPSPSGSSVWIISWKMVFLSEVLCRDAELPPLCRMGRTCRQEVRKRTTEYRSGDQGGHFIFRVQLQF